MTVRVEPCACGLSIRVTDPTDARIEVATRKHVASFAHQSWRGARYHECAGVGSPCAVTIPKGRDLCHWCSRTLALMARMGS